MLSGKGQVCGGGIRPLTSPSALRRHATQNGVRTEWPPIKRLVGGGHSIWRRRRRRASLASRQPPRAAAGTRRRRRRRREISTDRRAANLAQKTARCFTVLTSRSINRSRRRRRRRRRGLGLWSTYMTTERCIRTCSSVPRSQTDLQSSSSFITPSRSTTIKR